MKNVHIIVSSSDEPGYDVLKLNIPDKVVENFITNFLFDTPVSAPAPITVTKTIPHQPHNSDDNFLYKTILAILDGFAIGLYRFDGNRVEKVERDGMANKIRAIKAVRALSGLGLKEAKDLVEAAISWEDHEKSEAFEKN